MIDLTVNWIEFANIIQSTAVLNLICYESIEVYRYLLKY